MTKYVIDGTRVELLPADLDGDGITGGVERLHRGSGEFQVTQETELGQSLKELNDDSIVSDTKMSGIDMRAILHPMQVNSLAAIDTLVSMRCLPGSCLALSRQIKRLSVSINGKGREQIVNTVTGKREFDKEMQGGGGFGQKFKSFFGMGGGDNEKP